MKALYRSKAVAPSTRAARPAAKSDGRSRYNQPAPYGSLLAARRSAANPDSLLATISLVNGAGNGPTHLALSMMASDFPRFTVRPGGFHVTCTNLPHMV